MPQQRSKPEAAAETAKAVRQYRRAVRVIERANRRKGSLTRVRDGLPFLSVPKGARVRGLVYWEPSWALD